MENEWPSSKKTSLLLEDGKIATRFKLSALWASTALCYIEGDFTTFFPPGGYIQQSLAGKMGPFRTTQFTLLAGSIFVSIPCLLVALSVILPSIACRRLSIVFGVFYTLTNAVSAFTSSWAYFVYFGIVETMLTLLVICYAWKWTAEKAL